MPKRISHKEDKVSKRLSFIFDDEAHAELDRLERETPAVSKVDVIRRALKLYGYWHKKTNEGYTVTLEKEESKQGVEILI